MAPTGGALSGEKRDQDATPIGPAPLGAHASVPISCETHTQLYLRQGRGAEPNAETMSLFVVTPYAQDVQRVVTRVWTRFKTGR